MTSSALFTPVDQNTWQPTDAARGPWTPDALHGGPVAALLAHAALTHLDDLQRVRLTVEGEATAPLERVAVAADLGNGVSRECSGRALQSLLIDRRD